MQLVVEVVWAGGRMLKQYTLFFDPPTFQSAAPMPSPSRAPAQAVPSQPVEPVVQTRALPAPTAQDAPLQAPVVSAESPDVPDAVVTTPAPQLVAPPDPPARPLTEAGPPFDPLPEPVIEPVAEAPAPVEPEQPEPVIEPVSRGACTGGAGAARARD